MAKKLLLADDSQTIQRVVDIVLGPEGFKVTSCGNGDDALMAIGSIMPDIVLADIEMPGLNGYQLCAKIKENPNTHHIPVLLLAGAFEPFDEDLMRSSGADDYLLKPFESQELLSKVKSMLLEKEIVEVSVSDIKSEDKAFVDIAEPAAASASSQGESHEEYSFPELSEPKEKISAFEAELMESMKILETDFKPEETPGSDKIRIEGSSAGVMSMEDISKMVKDAVGAPPEVREYKFEVSEQPVKESKDFISIKAEPVKSDFTQSLAESLRSIIEKVIREQVAAILPGILENCLKQALSEISGPLQGIINTEIKKVVPEVAERIIKQEIERITSEIAK